MARGQTVHKPGVASNHDHFDTRTATPVPPEMAPKGVQGVFGGKPSIKPGGNIAGAEGGGSC